MAKKKSAKKSSGKTDKKKTIEEAGENKPNLQTATFKIVGVSPYVQAIMSTKSQLFPIM